MWHVKQILISQEQSKIWENCNDHAIFISSKLLYYLSFNDSLYRIILLDINHQLTSQVQNHGSEEEERVVSGLSALLLGICSIDNDGNVKDYSRYKNVTSCRKKRVFSCGPPAKAPDFCQVSLSQFNCMGIILPCYVSTSNGYQFIPRAFCVHLP